MNKTEILNACLNKPNEENILKCVEYCYGKTIDFKDEELFRMFKLSVRYLMRYKIGHFSKQDSMLLINYFSNYAAYKWGLGESVKPTILTEEEYSSKVGTSSQASCIDYGDDQIVYYSPTVVKQISSNDTVSFLRGMTTIFHEVVHCAQNSVIKSDREHTSTVEAKLSTYIMTIESIARLADKEFYNKNYRGIYKENHAEQIGLREALDAIKKYNTRLYDLYDIEEIEKRIEGYKESMESSLVVFGIENSHLKSMDVAVCFYVKDHPEVLEEFPLLNLSFKKDGSKKNIVELLQDRRNRIENGENIEELNKLYGAICNEKNNVAGGLTGTKEEVRLLIDYFTNNDYDEFEFSLLIHRFEVCKVPMEKREQITNFIENGKKQKEDYVEESDLTPKSHK